MSRQRPLPMQAVRRARVSPPAAEQPTVRRSESSIRENGPPRRRCPRARPLSNTGVYCRNWFANRPGSLALAGNRDPKLRRVCAGRGRLAALLPARVAESEIESRRLAKRLHSSATRARCFGPARAGSGSRVRCFGTRLQTSFLAVNRDLGRLPSLETGAARVASPLPDSGVRAEGSRWIYRTRGAPLEAPGLADAELRPGAEPSAFSSVSMRGERHG